MTAAFIPSGNAATRNTTARAANVQAEFQSVSDAFATYPEAANVLNGTTNYAVDTGTANALLVAMPTTATAYTDGMLVAVKALVSNTGSSTINVDGLGIKQIRRQTGSQVVAGDIVAGSIYEMRYNGTYFMLSGLGNSLVESVDNISSDISTVAGISANVTSVANNETNINSAVSNASNINSVAGNDTNITAVADNSTNINSVASNNANITTVANNITEVVAVGSNVSTIVSLQTDITTVADNETNVNTVATNDANVTTVADNIDDIIAAAAALDPYASQAEAEAGTAADRLMSPLRTKEAIAANIYSGPTSFINSATAVVKYNRYVVDTSSASVTVTLPASPSAGDFVELIRQGANTVVVARNGKTIAGSTTDLTIDVDGYGVTLLYNSTTGNWLVSGKVWA